MQDAERINNIGDRS